MSARDSSSGNHDNTSTVPPPPPQPSVEAGRREASSDDSPGPVGSFWKDLPRFRTEYKLVEAWPLIESPEPVDSLHSPNPEVSGDGDEGSVTATHDDEAGPAVAAARSLLGQQNAVDLPRTQTNWSHTDGVPAVTDLSSLSCEPPVTDRDWLPFAVRRNVHGYVLPKHIFPEHANKTLKFQSRDEAVRALESRVTDWKGCEEDDTIPHNDEHRRAWVLRLKLAMKNRDGLLNKGMHGNRWTEGKPYPYADDAVEKV